MAGEASAGRRKWHTCKTAKWL